MGFGQRSLKLKELIGVRNLRFCQNLSKVFFLSRTQMPPWKEGHPTIKTSVPSYEHSFLKKHLLP